MANSDTYYLDVFIHLLPIPLLFIYFVYPDLLQTAAHTFLGKSILVLFILLFSYISIWLGIFYCIALILYLQNPSMNPFQEIVAILNPIQVTSSPFYTPHPNEHDSKHTVSKHHGSKPSHHPNEHGSNEHGSKHGSNEHGSKHGSKPSHHPNEHGSKEHGFKPTHTI